MGGGEAGGRQHHKHKHEDSKKIPSYEKILQHRTERNGTEPSRAEPI